MYISILIFGPKFDKLSTLRRLETVPYNGQHEIRVAIPFMNFILHINIQVIDN